LLIGRGLALPFLRLAATADAGGELTKDTVIR
jgi:hypothetical protein